MKVSILASLLLLLAATAEAQYVQGGGHNVAPDTDYSAYSASYSFTFSKPLTSPCTIMVSDRYYGDTISDSQGNVFALATNDPTIPDYQSRAWDKLWYSKTCRGGPDTVTITYAKPSFAQYDVAEYAGVWVPDQVSPETINVVGTEGYTAPITPTQNGELIIAIGNNHSDNHVGITGAGGFTMRTVANQFIADMVQDVAAPIYGEVTYSSPVSWCQFTVSFKPGGPPPPFVFKLAGFGTFTFPMTAPPDCSDGSCSIVACDTTTNLCVTLTPGQSGYLAIRKPTGDTIAVQVSP